MTAAKKPAAPAKPKNEKACEQCGKITGNVEDNGLCFDCCGCCS